ncbi:hypothetical protein LTR35_010692 [Friedmanniomyces endolithicus]|uniref:Uncharacterized protein n=1 Tax=Friedmanniomyces endolithicus TaxID=329885 RepID=A0A4U0VFF2_9PEZI|nr:hypothetical protein LTS09_014038 [Friedmanniomyces endolithicus]KAK0275923.1 hypothetical protein LTR35_010692 [Friedmanniomyces endolithicus]KAK0292368.1 hypothetical protein LTS00_007845 [Friedmanniomyces endolithicus]KAK0309186.1 hypothetical protein LTR82_015238 [Friedmanniomyces endolithicus]KAK0311989.1 hypothetical protein LTR01_002903 [Friedmanniomyces endolithicus]
MPAEPPKFPLPPSYTSLPFTQIRCHHVPSTSQAVTPTIVLELHRPGKHNAFTETMMHELEHAFQLFDVDDRVKCIVVTGHGRIFCAGADLDRGFVGGQEAFRDHRDGGGRVALAIHRCRKPVIGALQGSAVGIGITMTLPMSIRVAFKDAKIGFVFARRGLIMEACSSFFLPRLIGMSKAIHLTTTGSTYPASHPLLNTLFSETLDTPAAVLPRALEIADEIVQNTSTVSSYLMRDLMYRDTGSAEGQHLLDSKLIYEMFGSKDNTEGVQSFLQKRPAKFVGSMQQDAPGSWPWYNPIETSNRPQAEGYKFRPKL